MTAANADGPQVLVVDVDGDSRAFLAELLAREGFACTAASDVEAARAALSGAPVELVICDPATAPGAIDLIEHVRGLHTRVSVLAVTDVEHVAAAERTLARGIVQGYLIKPLTPNGTLIGVLGALEHDASLAAAREAREETVLRLCVAAEATVPDAAAHLSRVAELSEQIAARLGRPARECLVIRAASSLHDIGHMSLPAGLLDEPRSLTRAEGAEMRRHPELGLRILAGSRSPLLQTGARIAWTHHERWNGSGYPRGLEGTAIPLEGRIVAVADAFDSLQRDRPHRPPVSRSEALQIVLDGRDTLFDPAVVEACAAIGGNDRGAGPQPPPPQRRARGPVAPSHRAALLTPREHQVLQLAADGLSAPEIAEELAVSAGTVKTHFQNMYAKLGASNRASAVAMALRKGIVA